MEKAKRKVIELFREYGIRAKDADIEAVLEVVSSFDNKSEDVCRKEFFPQLSKENIKLEIDDYEVFIEKVGLDKNWRRAPQWFFNGLELVILLEGKMFYLTTRKGRVSLRNETGSFNQKDEDFFEEVLEQEAFSEYQMKKRFLPREADELMRQIINDEYVLLQKETNDNKKLTSLSEKLWKMVDFS